MTKYFTKEAKQSKIKNLTHLITVVSTAPGNVINYTDAAAIIKVLAEYREELEKELLGQKK